MVEAIIQCNNPECGTKAKVFFTKEFFDQFALDQKWIFRCKKCDNGNDPFIICPERKDIERRAKDRRR